MAAFFDGDLPGSLKNAPHTSKGTDIIAEQNKSSVRFQLTYRTVIISAILLIGSLESRKYVWIIGISAGILSAPIGKVVQKLKYSALLRKIKT